MYKKGIEAEKRLLARGWSSDLPGDVAWHFDITSQMAQMFSCAASQRLLREEGAGRTAEAAGWTAGAYRGWESKMPYSGNTTVGHWAPWQWQGPHPQGSEKEEMWKDSAWDPSIASSSSSLGRRIGFVPFQAPTGISITLMLTAPAGRGLRTPCQLLSGSSGRLFRGSQAVRGL